MLKISKIFSFIIGSILYAIWFLSVDFSNLQKNIPNYVHYIGLIGFLLIVFGVITHLIYILDENNKKEE